MTANKNTTPQEHAATLRNVLASHENPRIDFRLTSYEAAALQFAIDLIHPQAASSTQATRAPDASSTGLGEGFGIDSAKLAALLDGCLKPEEIAGDAATQHKRVDELLHWFVRLTERSANPKWTTSHAYELAYYIATNAGNRHIDLTALQEASFKSGASITTAEREMLQRLGAIPTPASPPPGASRAVDEAQELMTLRRQIVVYQRAINEIDDRVEYSRTGLSRAEIHGILASITSALSPKADAQGERA